MPETNPFELLATEHELLRREVGLAILAARSPTSGAGRTPQVESLTDGLRIHFQREERALFPLCERFFGRPNSAVGVLHADHLAIGAALSPITGTAPSAAEATHLLEGVEALLESHFSREEKVLFPLVESRMTRAETIFLAKRLRSDPIP